MTTFQNGIPPSKMNKIDTKFTTKKKQGTSCLKKG